MYKKMDFGIDWTEVIRRALKYLFEGLAVGLASMYLIKGAKLEAAIMVGITAAATFAILDAFVPVSGASSRIGSGLAIGAQLVGGF
jgi:hypothetical protein